MGEFIADNAKAQAMNVPFLRDLLMSDSIHIASNITFDNLTPVSTYLGKPGDPARGGLPMDEYKRRQDQFKRAELDALRDTAYFADRARNLYGYPHFVCDTGGSICEWVDAEDPKDPVLTHLSDTCLMVWIKGSEDHTADLVQRFDKAPKPMAYQPEFLARSWVDYLNKNNVQEVDVDPDTFIRWTYARALAHRQPRYAAMARNWGVTVDASDMLHGLSEGNPTMPIRLPRSLPAFDVLSREGVMVMGRSAADQQDIRPLRIGLLNLMPKKIQTENQFARLIGATPLQIELTLIRMSDHEARNTAADHMEEFYRTFQEVKHEKFDGLIITGAPIEHLDFTDVTYWDELCEVMDWTQTHVHSTFGVCWGGMAMINYFHGVKKYVLDRKLFGCYRHMNFAPQSPYLRGFSDELAMPVSRWTEMKRDDLGRRP